MFNPIVHKFKYGKHTITLQTGMIARQATASVIASMDDTTVLVTVVAQKAIKSGQNFFPLTVNYQERTYSVGRIPGSFFRREGRPGENEILIARLIDRPIRPLFPKNLIHEIQIIVTVISMNPQIKPDIISIIGTSAVLTLSGIPFKGPIGAIRIGYIDNQYILNPTTDELKISDLDLVISSTKNAILMVESESNILNETQILDAIIYGYQEQQIVINNINLFVSKSKKDKWIWNPFMENKNIVDQVTKIAKFRIENAYKISEKQKRNETLSIIRNDVIAKIIIENDSSSEIEINEILYTIEKKVFRDQIFNEKKRIDGRTPDIIRSLDVQTGILPRTHGSALFTRGDTQALVTTTLGTARDAQNLDELTGERTDNFLFHYNFPPYSVGEIGISSSPKRREIGHGHLAKRSILAVMPKLVNFPYTIRIVSEITESNGSSSMASVCGASLSLMDAGVPIKSSVAGIAMGLVKEGKDFVILSDILGEEDHFGDMDFKVAGTRKGITSLQMDIKIEGITEEIIKIILEKAKNARMYILDAMEKKIKIPKKDISQFAPRIYVIKIHTNKIKDLIGKGGSVIRALTEETGTSIEIEDDGTVKIASNNSEKAIHTINRIKEITASIEVGQIYLGKITRIVEYGAFVNFAGNKEGLLHISQISEKRISKVQDYLNIGQEVKIKILEIDRKGRIRLSIKAISQ